jgi:hypothetical protein
MTTSSTRYSTTTNADTTLAAQLFARWASLDTPATAGTSFRDWDTCVYRDAVCFTRPGVAGADVYLLRGTSVITFGFDDDTIESAYQMLDVPPPEPKLNMLHLFDRALSQKVARA